MKKYISIPCAVFIFISSFFAQEAMKNPGTPSSENAGRTLKLKEILRIKEEGERFYFKQPSSLQVDDEGCIYVADESQFLKFSPDGKFLKNMYKKGQGPGEIQWSFSYGLEHDKICVHDSVSRKIILMDKAGELLEEIQLREKGTLRFIGVSEGRVIFSRFSMPERKDMKGIVDMKNQLIAIDIDDKSEMEIGIITTKWWFTERSGAAADPFTVIVSANGKSLYINYTPEYSIHVMDIEKGKTKNTFSREYKRVKAQKNYYPERAYEFDISRLFDCGKTLWVQTSTIDEKKGTLFDVFDKEGRYIDNFYLDVDGTLMAVDGGFIFVRMTDADGIIHIVKFRIVG